MTAEQLIDMYLEAITEPGPPVKWQVPPDKKRRKEPTKADADVGPGNARYLEPDGAYQGVA